MYRTLRHFRMLKAVSQTPLYDMVSRRLKTAGDLGKDEEFTFKIATKLLGQKIYQQRQINKIINRGISFLNDI